MKHIISVMFLLMCITGVAMSFGAYLMTKHVIILDVINTPKLHNPQRQHVCARYDDHHEGYVRFSYCCARFDESYLFTYFFDFTHLIYG